jgi:hypothetical protein
LPDPQDPDSVPSPRDPSSFVHPHLASLSSGSATADKSLFQHFGLSESTVHDGSLPHISQRPVDEEHIFDRLWVFADVHEVESHLHVAVLRADPRATKQAPSAPEHSLLDPEPSDVPHLQDPPVNGVVEEYPSHIE